jgi:hypothetical protein
MTQGKWKVLGVCMTVLTGCAGAEARSQGCEIAQRPTPLADGLSESSGVAASRTLPGVFWTHNDSGGEPEVTGVRLDGTKVVKVSIEGAKNRDWEDIAVGPCAGGSCLYIADTGDNARKQQAVNLYRAPEPREGTMTVRAERFSMRYPDGPRDVEAFFVLPTGQPIFISKGRNSGVALYRYPLPLRSAETIMLERVVVLDPNERKGADQVTSANASPSGRWVAIRSYRSLLLFRTEALLRGETQPARTIDLSPVGEAQGEAVEIGDDGRIVLTSEAGFKGSPGTISVLRCPLP